MFFFEKLPPKTHPFLTCTRICYTFIFYRKKVQREREKQKLKENEEKRDSGKRQARPALFSRWCNSSDLVCVYVCCTHPSLQKSARVVCKSTSLFLHISFVFSLSFLYPVSLRFSDTRLTLTFSLKTIPLPSALHCYGMKS